MFYTHLREDGMSEALKRMASEYMANAKLLLGRINELKAELARTSRNTWRLDKA